MKVLHAGILSYISCVMSITCMGIFTHDWYISSFIVSSWMAAQTQFVWCLRDCQPLRPDDEVLLPCSCSIRQTSGSILWRLKQWRRPTHSLSWQMGNYTVYIYSKMYSCTYCRYFVNFGWKITQVKSSQAHFGGEMSGDYSQKPKSFKMPKSK